MADLRIRIAGCSLVDLGPSGLRWSGHKNAIRSTVTRTMARLIPSDFDLSACAEGLHAPEARTLARLRDGLSDRYTIYHNVHWARAERSGSTYGEIDFIVESPYGRLLAIEQKDTQIVATENDLFARYRGARDANGIHSDPKNKSITTQVNRNLNALRSQFARRHPGHTLDIDHLLYLPTARLQGAVPASVDPARVIDADRDGELVATVESLLEDPPGNWSDARMADLPLIESFLSEQIGATPHIGLLGQTAREFTTRLSGGLSTWASRLSMHPWRLRIQGTAGSGKTQLALQALREAHAAGKATLYVCYNRPLADAMKLAAPDRDVVVTFHELARMVIRQSGRADVDFNSEGVFDTLAQSFIELSPGLAGAFDTLVIDEGQDFQQVWADALMQMAHKDARVLWLEDPEQSLYDRVPVALPDWVTLASPVNYRSPQLLIEFINWMRLTEVPVEAGSAVIGFDPGWREYEDDSPIAATEAAVSDLLHEGYAPESIAVLSFRGLGSSQLAGSEGPKRLAGHRVRRQAGYDAQGVAQWSAGELMVDTVNRFKGQSADAVVITEIDFESFGQRERRRLFVALTRARLQAVLVSSGRATEALQRRLGES